MRVIPRRIRGRGPAAAPGEACPGGREAPLDDESLTFGDDEAPGPAGNSVEAEVESPPEAAGVETTAVFGLNAAEAGIGTTTEEGGKAG